MLKTDTIRLLRNARDISQEDTVILLTASTGVAAFNIGGSSVHSVFQIHEMSKYEPLEGDKANTVITSGSAIAEGPCEALVSRNPATAKHLT